MRAKIVTRTDLRVGRIQDKTRWTKALGGAATIVYGDCKEDICQSNHRTAVGHERPGYVFIEFSSKKRGRGSSETPAGLYASERRCARRRIMGQRIAAAYLRHAVVCR